ncbi:MAG: hypothetical protein IH851_02070, partial [Armatimonadetes bacterium]|nr:hypothetical protein [Armatimonadota bacterium]
GAHAGWMDVDDFGSSTVAEQFAASKHQLLRYREFTGAEVHLGDRVVWARADTKDGIEIRFAVAGQDKVLWVTALFPKTERNWHSALLSFLRRYAPEGYDWPDWEEPELTPKEPLAGVLRLPRYGQLTLPKQWNEQFERLGGPPEFGPLCTLEHIAERILLSGCEITEAHFANPDNPTLDRFDLATGTDVNGVLIVEQGERGWGDGKGYIFPMGEWYILLNQIGQVSPSHEKHILELIEELRDQAE